MDPGDPGEARVVMLGSPEMNPTPSTGGGRFPEERLLEGLGIAVVGNFAPKGSGIFYQQEVLVDDFTAEGATCVPVTYQQNRFLRPFATAAELLRHRGRYQVLCCQGFSNWNWINSAFAIVTAKMLHKPITMVYRGGGFAAFAARAPWTVLPFLRRVDVLIVPSGYLHREFDKHGLRHRIIPNVIELDGWPYKRRERLAPKLLWVRHIRPGYNPWMAVEVLQRIRQRYPDATLTMAGDGNMEEEMRRRIADENVQGVTMVGHLPLVKLRELLTTGDIFINTTNVDNQPRSVMEAMACGLPVVSTDVGGIPFLIDHRVQGLLVPPRDPDAMAAAVCELLDDPALGLRLADAAIEMVRSFSWKQSRFLWRKVYEDAGVLPCAATRTPGDPAESGDPTPPRADAAETPVAD
jgi:L-malate glycosyltransferase